MGTEALMSQEELDEHVRRAWQNAREGILKQVEFAVTGEMCDRARSRAQVLVTAEVDAVLKPKIASMRKSMEEHANQIASKLLPKLKAAMRESLRQSIHKVADDTVNRVLSQASAEVRYVMVNALTEAEREDNSET
jgi:hypothetical protein